MTAAPIHVEIEGIPAVLPELSVELPDGRTGWFQRSQTDCLRAAVATATQVPYDELGEIPNLGALHALGRPFGVRRGDALRAARPRAGMIGIGPCCRSTRCAMWSSAPTASCAFDPASGWIFPGGLSAEPARELDPNKIIYFGLSPAWSAGETV